MSESFEDQALMMRRLAKGAGHLVKPRFEAVALTLERLGALRRKCIEGAEQETDLSDEVAADLVILLRIPTE